MAEKRCPMCDRVFDPEASSSLPFCSDRCRLRDLGGWLDERYGLPYESLEEEPPPEPG